MAAKTTTNSLGRKEGGASPREAVGILPEESSCRAARRAEGFARGRLVARPMRVAACALLLVAAACTETAQGPVGRAGAKGAPVQTGPVGSAGVHGPIGSPGPAAQQSGRIDGMVTAAATGLPLAAVQVEDPELGLATTTASDGTFSFTKLSEGVYELTLALPGFVTQAVGVPVGANGTVHASFALATSTGGLAVSVQDSFIAGYDSDVTLTAMVTTTEPDGAALNYSWTQTGGTPAQLSSTTAASISFHTLKLSDAKLEAKPSAVLGPYDGGGLVPGRFGPMGIAMDETGNYQFSVTVTDPAGRSATTAATVWATPPASGLRSVPIGLPVWFEGDALGSDGGAQSTWRFALTPPSGSKATLQGGSRQFVSFTPDITGSYAVTESVSGKSTTVHAATWDGISGVPTQPGSGNDYAVQGCTSTCHVGSAALLATEASGAAPDMFKYWASTRHATATADGLDGLLGATFGPTCLTCHALGDSPAATNGGFADVAAADAWTFPATLAPENYANLVADEPTLAQLANVQCESCHGPKNLDVMGVDDTAAKSYGTAVCAQCHSEADQWKQSLHADLQVAINEATTEGPAPANCARCHSAQGFAEYTQELRAGCVAAGSASCLLTSDGNPPLDGGANAAEGGTYAALGLVPSTVQPLTCAGCHDPHDVAQQPFQLRVYDTVPTTLMNGQAVTGVGAGATCMVCHNSRPAFAEVDDFSVSANKLTAASTLITPHNGTQTDVLFGANAYFMPRLSPSPHLAVTDTCAGCHAIPTAAQRDAGVSTNHAFATDLSICSTCHSAALDGAELQQPIVAGLAQVDQSIYGAVSTLLTSAVGSESGTYNTTVRDAATLEYLCITGLGAPDVYLPLGVVPITYAPFLVSAGPPVHATRWRNLGTVLVTFATNPFVQMAGLAECSGTTTPTVVAGVTYQGGPVVLSVSAAQAGTTHASSNPPLVSAVSITGKSIYNEALLSNDLSLGIHNLPFAQALIATTLAQLANVTPTNP